jgi:hypothetical protein
MVMLDDFLESEALLEFPYAESNLLMLLPKASSNPKRILPVFFSDCNDLCEKYD